MKTMGRPFNNKWKQWADILKTNENNGQTFLKQMKTMGRRFKNKWKQWADVLKTNENNGQTF